MAGRSMPVVRLDWKQHSRFLRLNRVLPQNHGHMRSADGATQVPAGSRHRPKTLLPSLYPPGITGPAIRETNSLNFISESPTSSALCRIQPRRPKPSMMRKALAAILFTSRTMPDLQKVAIMLIFSTNGIRSASIGWTTLLLADFSTRKEILCQASLRQAIRPSIN